LASDEDKVVGALFEDMDVGASEVDVVVGASVFFVNASVYNVVVDEYFVVEVALVVDVVVYGSVVVVGAYDIVVFSSNSCRCSCWCSR
jgi:hypothetical protein